MTSERKMERTKWHTGASSPFSISPLFVSWKSKNRERISPSAIVDRVISNSAHFWKIEDKGHSVRHEVLAQRMSDEAECTTVEEEASTLEIARRSICCEAARLAGCGLNKSYSVHRIGLLRSHYRSRSTAVLCVHERILVKGGIRFADSRKDRKKAGGKGTRRTSYRNDPWPWPFAAPKSF